MHEEWVIKGLTEGLLEVSLFLYLSASQPNGGFGKQTVERKEKKEKERKEEI